MFGPAYAVTGRARKEKRNRVILFAPALRMNQQRPLNWRTTLREVAQKQ
jgi:hypothetical protein